MVKEVHMVPDFIKRQIAPYFFSILQGDGRPCIGTADSLRESGKGPLMKRHFSWDLRGEWDSQGQVELGIGEAVAAFWALDIFAFMGPFLQKIE